jgi:hypothetical protein
MSNAQELLSDIEYLEAAGMRVEDLRRLHHWEGDAERERRVSYQSTRDYFSKGGELGVNNAAFANRVHFVAETHRRGFSGLVSQALERFPRTAA